MTPRESKWLSGFAAKLPPTLGAELRNWMASPTRGRPPKDRLFEGTYHELLKSYAIIEYRDLIADNWDNEEALAEVARKHAKPKIGLAEGTIRQACIGRGGSKLPKVLWNMLEERNRLAARYGLEPAMKMLRTKIEHLNPDDE